MQKLSKIIIILLFILVYTSRLIGQDLELCNCSGFDVIKEVDSTEAKEKSVPCLKSEEMPKFPGGELELKKFLKANSSFEILDDMELSDRGDFVRVMVCLEFDKEGTIIDKKVRTKYEKYKIDAYNIIDLMPRWIPAEQMKQKVIGYNIFMIPYKKE